MGGGGGGLGFSGVLFRVWVAAGGFQQGSGYVKLGVLL